MPPVEDFSKNQEICGPFDPKKGPSISQDVLSRIYGAIIEDFMSGQATPGRGMTEKMDYKERATYNMGGLLPEAIVDCGNGKTVDMKLLRDGGGGHIWPSISVEMNSK
jgi:hypothetical protein